MKLLAGLLIVAIAIALFALHNSNENGLSGVWDEITGADTPQVNRIEQDLELDISTP